MWEKFRLWLNGTSMTSLKEFLGILLMVYTVIHFTIVAGSMLTVSPRHYFREVPLMVNADSLKISMANYLREANDFTEDSRQTGFNLALAVLAAIGLVKGITTYQHGKDRDTSKEKIREDGIAAAGIERAKGVAGNGNGHNAGPTTTITNAETVTVQKTEPEA